MDIITNMRERHINICIRKYCSFGSGTESSSSSHLFTKAPKSNGPHISSHNEPGVCIHGPIQFMMSWQILVVVGERGAFANSGESVKLMSSWPLVHVEVGLLMALHNTTLLGSTGSSCEFQKKQIQIVLAMNMALLGFQFSAHVKAALQPPRWATAAKGMPKDGQWAPQGHP